MKRELWKLIESKREWSKPLTSEDKAKGFKGWYASRNLPHFDSHGVQQYISYRLADSMPTARRGEWEAFPHLEDDQEKLRKINPCIDRGYGACHLRDPHIADLVQSNWWHHDGVRYRLLAWVIMPNHVHLLIETWSVPLGDILHSRKSYTSKQANSLLGLTGVFWAQDYFDCFIRDESHFRRVTRYIENNPVKAGLVMAPEDWPWSSARYRGEPGPLVPVLTHPTANRSPQPPESSE
jgi:REP element-mobilizing transposase RayT